MSAEPHPRFDRFAPPYLEDPYPLYEQLRSQAPVFYSSELGLWIVTRYQDARAILMDPQHFSSAFYIRTPYNPPPEVQAVLDQGYPEIQILLNEDPPHHTRTRAIVARAFVPRRIKALEPRIQALADALIDGFAADGQADLVGRLAFPLPVAVICELIGLPLDDADRLKQWAHDLVMLTAPTTTLEQQVACAQCSVDCQRYFERHIDARRRQPSDDLLSDIVHHEDARDLTTADLISILISIVFAGHETTTNLIGTTLLLLLRERERWQALLDAPASIGAVIEEALRIDPPVQGMFRVAAEGALVAGVPIPAGDRLYFLIGSANHDSAVFANPQEFDPARPQLDQHLSFGRGIHFCIGAALARLEAQIAIGTLARRLPHIRLAPDRPVAYLPNIMHRGPLALPVLWETR